MTGCCYEGRPHLSPSNTIFIAFVSLVQTMGSVKAIADTIELHHDVVSKAALGGHSHDLGKKYFTSAQFIGTVVVSISIIV